MDENTGKKKKKKQPKRFYKKDDTCNALYLVTSIMIYDTVKIFS